MYKCLALLRRFQDFLYRRAVASCCRALWCCCSCPCLPDIPDDNDIDNVREDTKQQSARVSAAENMEGGLEAGSMRTIAFSAPAHGGIPAQAKTEVAQPSTPCDPREAFFIAPRRPDRPCRKTTGNSGSTGDSSSSLDSSGTAEGSASRTEEKEEHNVRKRGVCMIAHAIVIVPLTSRPYNAGTEQHNGVFWPAHAAFLEDGTALLLCCSIIVTNGLLCFYMPSRKLPWVHCRYPG